MYLCDMNTFDDFIHKVKRLGICDEYAEKVAKAGSKKSFMDIALSSGATPGVCEMIRRGELTQETIAKEFESFNGKYVRSKDGYTSKMHCLPDTDEIIIDTTLTLIIGFNGVIHVPANRVCELYIVKSDARIEAECTAIVHSYDGKIAIAGNGNVNVKIH